MRSPSRRKKNRQQAAVPISSPSGGMPIMPFMIPPFDERKVKGYKELRFLRFIAGFVGMVVLVVLASQMLTWFFNPTLTTANTSRIKTVPFPAPDPAASIFYPGGYVTLTFPTPFKKLWEHTGDPSLSIRLWGQGPNTQLLREYYEESVGQMHGVLYFDKGRMEGSYQSPESGSVTSGLLASELLSGYLQVGKDTYVRSCSPETFMLGKGAPTYATFQQLADPIRKRQNIERDFRGGYVSKEVTEDGALKDHSYQDGKWAAESRLVLYAKDDIPDGKEGAHAPHNVPSIFCNFLLSLVQKGKTCDGKDTPTEYWKTAGFWDISGFPISEPYWATAQLGSPNPENVLFQVFERRVLYYQPETNRDDVLITNIGLDYFDWRYIHPIDPLEGACP